MGLAAERAGEAEDSAEEPSATPLPEQLGSSREDILYQQKIPGAALPCTHTAPCTPRIIGSSPSQILIKVSQELNFNEHCVNFPGIANHVASR